MSYSRIENALRSVLPKATFEIQAPDSDADGAALTRYLVWTPTGERYLYAEGAPLITVHQAIVTVATQIEGDTLSAEVRAALARARVAMQQPEHSYEDATATYYTDIPCEVV